MRHRTKYDEEDLFDYPHEWTEKVLDANGYYKLNDLHKVYNRFPASKIGELPTDPPIYNADGFVVTRNGACCISGPEEMIMEDGTKVTITRVYPNVPHKDFILGLGLSLFKKFINDEEAKKREECFKKIKEEKEKKQEED